MAEEMAKKKKDSGEASPAADQYPTREDVKRCWPKALQRWGLAVQVDTAAASEGACIPR